MADENTIIEPVPQPDTRAQERITQLSDKVRTEAGRADAAETKATAAERRATFAEGFVDIMATNPSAKEFKSDIQAKVEAGLSVEDATYAVLGKAGKLGAPAPVVQQAEVAGGSAATTPQTGTKTASEMTQDERRAELAKELVWQ